MADDAWLFEDVHLVPASAEPTVGRKTDTKLGGFASPQKPQHAAEAGTALHDIDSIESPSSTGFAHDHAKRYRDWSVSALLNIPFPPVDVSNVGNLGVKKLKDFERGVARSMMLPPIRRLQSLPPSGGIWGHVASRAESDVLVTGGFPAQSAASAFPVPITWRVNANSLFNYVAAQASMSATPAAQWEQVLPPSDPSVSAALTRWWPAAAYFPSTGTLLMQGGESATEVAGQSGTSSARSDLPPGTGSAVKRRRPLAAPTSDAGALAAVEDLDGVACAEDDPATGTDAASAGPSAEAEATSSASNAGRPTPDLLAFDARHLRVWYPPVCKGRAPPPGLSGHSMSVIRDASTGQEFGIVFGGVRGRHWLCDTFLLNPRSLRWQQVRTYGKAPTQRAHHTAAVVDAGRKLVIFGGCNGADSFNDVYVLDCAGGVSAAASEERWTWSQPAIRGRGEAQLTCF